MADHRRKAAARRSQYYYYSPNRPAYPVNRTRLHIGKFTPGSKFVLAGIVLLAIGLLTAANFLAIKPNDGQGALWQEQVVPPVDTSAMGEQIEEVIATNPHLQISVAYIDLNHNIAKRHGQDEPFIAASMSKLLTAINYLAKVEKNEAILEGTIIGGNARLQLEQMIVESDNIAWLNINDFIGRQNLQLYAASIGLHRYNATTNTITSDEVAQLLKKLYGGELLNQKHTDLMLSYMQQANRREYIASAVPDGIKLYHKAGWLDDRVHDAAIIDNGQNPYVLVIFIKGQDNFDGSEGIKIFRRIASISVEAFNYTACANE